MRLVEHPAINLDLKYATADNITGTPIYAYAVALLHPEAHAALIKAAELASAADRRLIVFDAYRPPAAQRRLWEALPDPTFIADPEIGSTHSRGIAVDLTLAYPSGEALPMGTGFDAMEPASFHAHPGLPADVQGNRQMLAGIMALAGWVHNPMEWWHYNLPDPEAFPIVDDPQTVARMMS